MPSSRHGNVDIVSKALDHIRELNKVSSIITERHKFFKLLDIAQSTIIAAEITQANENEETDFVGGQIVSNYSEIGSNCYSMKSQMHKSLHH